jgi:hypothetical protein
MWKTLILLSLPCTMGFLSPPTMAFVPRIRKQQGLNNTKRLFLGFFDDLFNDSSKKNQNDKKESPNTKRSEGLNEVDLMSLNNNEDMMSRVEENESWNVDVVKEIDFIKEVEKRNLAKEIKAKAITIEEKDKEFDGYALRDAIYAKWGCCYDLEFQKVETFGFRNVYLNVMPFKLGGRRFRHRTELDYLMHLQAVVEILEKYEQLDYVLSQIESTDKTPRGNTSPLVAVPLRLSLSENELNKILNRRGGFF